MNTKHYKYQYPYVNKHARFAVVYLLLIFTIYLAGKYQLNENKSPLLSPLAPTVFASEKVEVKVEKTEKEKILDYIKEVFGKDAPLMTAIATCESSLNPKAKGPTSDYGLFQIHQPSHNVSPKFLYDYKINTLIAKKLFDESGVGPWKSSKGCWSVKN